ncbi:MAG: hypothetical protein WC764_04335 [Candidatus Paceibacterota bacterium]|jgi:hypothetical protein
MKSTEKNLAIQARDAKAQYENMKGLYLKGRITWSELRPYRAEAEKAEKEMRSAIKKGSYAEIERGLKTKYQSANKESARVLNNFFQQDKNLIYSH